MQGEHGTGSLRLGAEIYFLIIFDTQYTLMRKEIW